MKIYEYPSRADWPEICRRPEQDRADLASAVGEILAEVRDRGDEAVREFTRRFDGCDADIIVSDAEIAESARSVSDELKSAIEIAGENIRRFHEAQEPVGLEIETFPGVVCGTRQVAIEKVGLYAPGGTAPLFSSVMMLAIPASIAGCSEIVLCTPPGPDGKVHPAVLYTAHRFGVTKIVRAGGAQAVAALAYGTESVPRVDKIFGPGNRFVTAAKMQVSAEGTAIDMPAGPSEVAVIADRASSSEFVAADLLAQAEHGTDSQVVLISDTRSVIDEVIAESRKQLEELPRREIAEAALSHSFAVLLRDIGEAVDFANEYAAEHLIIATADADAAAMKITNAGSIFIGKYSCESAGDYASGTNHTLPTNGFARAYSGVTLASFTRQITYQRISAEGLLGLGPVIERLAEAEDLIAHRNAVSVRIREAESSLAQSAGGPEDAR